MKGIANPAQACSIDLSLQNRPVSLSTVNLALGVNESCRHVGRCHYPNSPRGDERCGEGAAARDSQRGSDTICPSGCGFLSGLDERRYYRDKNRCFVTSGFTEIKQQQFLLFCLEPRRNGRHVVYFTGAGRGRKCFPLRRSCRLQECCRFFKPQQESALWRGNQEQGDPGYSENMLIP